MRRSTQRTCRFATDGSADRRALRHEVVPAGPRCGRVVGRPLSADDVRLVVWRSVSMQHAGRRCRTTERDFAARRTRAGCCSRRAVRECRARSPPNATSKKNVAMRRFGELGKHHIFSSNATPAAVATDYFWSRMNRGCVRYEIGPRLCRRREQRAVDLENGSVAHRPPMPGLRYGVVREVSPQRSAIHDRTARGLDGPVIPSTRNE